MNVAALLDFVQDTGTVITLAPSRPWSVPLHPDAPIEVQVADALRCTEHIPDRDIRARYILKDLELRGFIAQRVRRDVAGRFVSRVPPPSSTREAPND